VNLLDSSLAELADELARRGVPRYRAAQIWRWIFEGRATSFAEMTDLPLALRTELAEWATLYQTRVAEHRHSRDGTEKLLVALADGNTIECVLIRDGDRRTVCISTQVGCGMGCVFCASGLDGVVRNLSRGEIIEQLLRLTQVLPAEERITNVVVMGMGEPLANLPALLPALETATSPEGFAMSARRITVSTVGLPAAIDRLAAEDMPYHLAVSLHAPDNELRNQIVPVNPKIGVTDIVAAADRYFDKTGRRVTYEYVLLGGLNDRPEHARRLAELLAGRNALVNVIPYNPVAGLPYETPTPADRERFIAVLRERGVNVHIRLRKGDEIDAACGQLRRVRQKQASSAPS
jgi:23S rRNA (adenine2503-C2)-methyltransferase